MPNGYTYKVEDGTVTTFHDFALDCARAFGALYSLRDTPEAPIPEEFVASDYHREALERAKADLAAAEAMTLEEAAVRAQQDFDKRIQSAAEYLEKATAENARYDAMIAKVKRWKPPTADHINMKESMLQWLDDSKRSETLYGELPEKPEDPQTWLDERIERARQEVTYHAEHWAKEKESAASRTAWVRALIESLDAFDEEATA